MIRAADARTPRQPAPVSRDAALLAEEEARQPGRPVTLFCTDEHRIGLKPATRRVWAPRGHRPTALGHHRSEWLSVTAFVAPATGESHWYVGNGVSKPLFEALLAAFAREAGAGCAHDPPAPRWCRLAHRARSGHPRGPAAGLPAALHPRTPARRAPLAARR